MPPRDEDPMSGDEMMLNEEEQEEEEAREQPKRRKKKLKMGEESGFTAEERRLLRRSQRAVNKALHDGPVDNDDDEHFVTGMREKNNVLFEKVAFTREAVLDAENVHAIASKLSKKVDDMIQVPRYDPLRFVCKLKNKLTGRTANGQSYFDWQTLGAEAGVCFNSIPSRVTFMVGPLENGRVPEKRKVTAVRQKKVVEEDAEEEKPEELAKKEKKSADQLSQADRNLNDMRKLLDKRCQQTKHENKVKYAAVKENEPENEKFARLQLKEHGEEIDFVRFLVNPKSFTQTIENIFNFSFLVKRGHAKIKMRKPSPLSDSSNGAVNPLDLPLAGCFVTVGEKDYDTPSKQCVIPFSMKDWRRLREAYDLDECDIPHRVGTKQTKTMTASQSQSQSSQEEEADE